MKKSLLFYTAWLIVVSGCNIRYTPEAKMIQPQHFYKEQAGHAIPGPPKPNSPLIELNANNKVVETESVDVLPKDNSDIQFRIHERSNRLPGSHQSSGSIREGSPRNYHIVK